MIKSILQEDSSLGGAVNKAWELAGKPANFSLKVLTVGETNFLGFSKKPYRISFTYGFMDKNSSGQDKQSNRRNDSNQSGARRSSNREGREARDGRDGRRNNNEKFGQSKQERTDRPANSVPSEAWSAELEKQVISFLQEIVQALGIDVKVESKIVDNVLQLNLNQPFLDDQSANSSFVISTSNLLMQMLRKQTKKALRGLKVVIKTNS